MKKILVLLLVIISILVLVGCGTLYDSKALFEYAQKEHGRCTLVSSEDYKNGGSKIVVHDILQDFDYTITSDSQDLSVDGGSFGSIASRRDTFNEDLINKVFPDFEASLDLMSLSDYFSYQINYSSLSLSIFVDSEYNAKEIADSIIDSLKTKNEYGRLNGFVVNVYDAEYHKLYSATLNPSIW